MTQVTVVSGTTESGDTLPFLAFREPPTEEEVLAIYREMMPEEFICENGKEIALIYPEAATVDVR